MEHINTAITEAAWGKCKDRGFLWLKLGRFSGYLSHTGYRPKGLYEIEREDRGEWEDITIWFAGFQLEAAIRKKRTGTLLEVEGFGLAFTAGG